MPDKWEYPYFCVWDSAFHAITLALIDPDFAKEQILLFTQPWYSKDNGQIPSCEFGFDEVNPPILAWAALKVDEIEHDIYGSPCDQKFLQLIFDNLQKTLDWWLKNNRLPKQSGETKEKYVGSKSVLSEHKYYSIAKDCYLGKHSGV
ncbi:MGH1-like glycoside hydrolase domain-containing protein, partial [Microcystis aeruginosa]|uniref:MGH1-like glycoside hydrolase domain-containing protein n=1 Tax=Microcystis aeruginosa TaxID=1126 RepID=UPI003FA1B173